MLDKILKPFTTASAGGVAAREIFQAIVVIIGIFSMLGILTQEQADALRKVADELFGQWPQIAAALATLSWLGMFIYRTAFKSFSDKAASVAKTVDADVPAAAPVIIQTPIGQDNIVIGSDGRKLENPGPAGIDVHGNYHSVMTGSTFTDSRQRSK